MISVVHNEIARAVEIYLDLKGVDLLIEKLQQLKLDDDHLHLYATDGDHGLSMKSPYREIIVSGQLIYSVHAKIRKLAGRITRKLSMTESQNSAHLAGTSWRKKARIASANCRHVG
jgi:hypothetical protein